MSRRPQEQVHDVQVQVYDVPTDRPEADGTLAWSKTTIIVVEVSAGGQTGIGWTYGPRACAEVVREDLTPVVVGASPLAVGRCWVEMVKRTRNAGRPGVVGYAISAVDVALWDLKARLLQLPLHQLLGAVHDRVPAYGSGGFTTYDEDALKSQLCDWVDRQGFPSVKIKIGEDWGRREDRDLERVRAARDIVGPEIGLFVDANGAYSAKQAVRLGRSLDALGVSWFEEPVSSDDLDGLRQVRDRVEADVAAGEYGSDLTYFMRMCAAGAVDCLQVDASRCGGISEWSRAAAVAQANGLAVSAHCAPNLHVPCAAATPNLRHIEWFHDHVRIENLLFDGALDPRDGALVPNSHPGHGLTVRRSDLESFRIG